MNHEWLLNTIAQFRAEGDYRQLLWDFPPATEEQLLDTEKMLGFPLPQILRVLYREVGNGGDLLNGGPLIFGALGGCSPIWERAATSTIDQLISRSGQRLDEQTAAKLKADPHLFIEFEQRPDGFVSFADLGCMTTAEWDGWSRRVYLRDRGQTIHDYRIESGREPTMGSEYERTAYIAYLAPTVEDFMRKIIEDRSYPEFPALRAVVYRPSAPNPVHYQLLHRFKDCSSDYWGDIESNFWQTDELTAAEQEERDSFIHNSEPDDLPVTSYRVLGPDEL